jgi:hypothetical protein
MQLSMPKALSLLAAGLCLLLLASPAFGWTPASMNTIGEQAARLAPPDLHRQLAKNRESYRIGLAKPFELSSELRNRNEDGSGKLDSAALQAAEMAIAAIQGQRPFNEIAYRMGVAVHLVSMINWPLATSSKDREEARYEADFGRYAATAEPRLRLVFYGFRPALEKNRLGKGEPRHLKALLDEAFARSRRTYPLVGLEYRRIGYGSGARLFDDRSTAYAIGSLSYSHAVSDSAEVLRYIWLAAGGGDTRSRIPLRGQQLVQLAPLSSPRPAAAAPSR